MGKPSYRRQRPEQGFWKQSSLLLQTGTRPLVTHHIQAPEDSELLSETVPGSCYLPSLVSQPLGPGCALAFKHIQEVRAGGSVTDGTRHTAPSSRQGWQSQGWEDIVTWLSRTQSGGEGEGRWRTVSLGCLVQNRAEGCQMGLLMTVCESPSTPRAVRCAMRIVH